ncbi:hypothetical protein FRC14_004515 [Serendipita sp. 396]|nr:hypothetical protein FRC14_004515 [Serendipita sp. 396]KAG8788070.1 hypothetical protein FRC15_006389 [Serendipita sp. 397]KAG8826627.1 hypothetical protein FRC19_008456 [Serendipita sp. 401]KAG8874151.1 hypothetical protein FRC20_006662 [Serendipita sp. 405]KAG9056906.1 hypothetical protein FS842_009187 [Serendipita sp. 407]
MTLRVVALYNRSRWIIISLWLTFFLCYGFALGLDIYATTFNKAHAYIAPIGGVCDVLNAPHYFALIFCVPLVYELYLTVLTLKQGVIHARALRQLSVAPFLRILFVEKIVYFIAITAIRIALIWLLVSGQNLFTGLGFLWSLEVVIVSRFHLEMNVIFHVGSATTSLWTSSEKGNYTKPDVTFARGEMTETQDIQMATIEEHRSQGQLATIEERPSQGREAV